VSAELEARRTAAAAALADYRQAVEAEAQRGGQPVPWALWAGRLGAALDSVLAIVPDGPGTGQAPLTTAQLSTVLAALDDAAAFRTERAGAYCLECSESPPGLCVAHADDLDQADAYRYVTRAIGGRR